MVTSYTNAKILVDNKIVEGDLVVKDNKIEYVGKDYKGNVDKKIDIAGNLLMPTFKNVHAHSPMVFLRSHADDLPLDEWLFNQVFPYEAKLDEKSCYYLTKLAILEYLSSGIGLCSDMYFHLDAICEASKEYKFRNVILEGLTQSNGPKENIYKKLDAGFKNIDKKGLCEYRVGIHAEYTNEMDNFLAVNDYIHEKKLPLYVHMSETKKEVNSCVEKYGKTPVELFSDIGLFDFGGIVYHMVHPIKDDLKILKSKNVSVCSCPASNMKLASGIAPICKMQEFGINVAIGTDGPASNNSLDMFKEMFLITALQKVSLFKADALSALDVLDMATKNGSKALGLENLDSIKVGQYADFIEIDLNLPNMQPLNNIAKNIVYAAGKQNVKMTVINGEILYRNGEYYLNDDIDSVYSKANDICKNIMHF